jgi:hypothetical protein
MENKVIILLLYAFILVDLLLGIIVMASLPSSSIVATYPAAILAFGLCAIALAVRSVALKEQ